MVIPQRVQRHDPSELLATRHEVEVALLMQDTRGWEKHKDKYLRLDGTLLDQKTAFVRAACQFYEQYSGRLPSCRDCFRRAPRCTA